MASSTAEPIVSRLDRLDLMLRHLEGMTLTPRSSYTSSGTLTASTNEGDGVNSSPSMDSSPNSKSLEKHCRPIDAVVMETEVKGSLIVRLALLEDRLLKLCVQLEEERQEQMKKKQMTTEEDEEKKKESKRGLRRLVRSCVGGTRKTKTPIKH